jgi:hypothetical protein
VKTSNYATMYSSRKMQYNAVKLLLLLTLPE